MVVFVCASCGTSLKKNQVENHWHSRCGQSPVSCMDCGRDFRGMEYNGHTKCISEDEKYGGSNYKSKEKKGETKQAEWMTYVQEMVRTKKDMTPKVKHILQSIMSGNNVQNLPRKKAKFFNYVQNSHHTKDPNILEDVWTLLEAGNFRNVSTNKGNEKKENTTEQSKKEEDAKNVPGNTDQEEEGSKLSKRERKKAKKMTEKYNGMADPDNEKWMMSKKERKIAKKMKEQNEDDKDIVCAVVKLEIGESKMSKKERKKAMKLKRANMDDDNDSLDIKAGSKRKLDVDGDDNVGEDGENRKKKKKRKSNETEASEEETPAPGERKKKMKKKGEIGDYLNSSLVPNTNHDQDMTNEHNVEGPSSFKWKTAITSVVEMGPEEGMKIKKVKKQVFALYMASDKGQSNGAKSESEISALFGKKIKARNNKFVVVKDRVKLRTD